LGDRWFTGLVGSGQRRHFWNLHRNGALAARAAFPSHGYRHHDPVASRAVEHDLAANEPRP
jgi:hypothetical protein